MASVNKVILIGHLGRDPETRYGEEGDAVSNVSLATTRVIGEGQHKREEIEWHRLVFFNRLAEVAKDFLRKGRPIYVEGRLKTSKWADSDGKDMYRTDVVIEQLQMLDDGRRQERRERVDKNARDARGQGA